MRGAAAIARRYAGTFLRDSRSTDPQVIQTVETLHGAISAAPQLVPLLRNRSVPASLKVQALEKALKDIPAFLTAFFKLMARHDRISYLPETVAEILEQSRRIAGVREGEIRSAHPLTEQQVNAIAKRFSASTGLTWHLSNTVDPHLLAGFQVRSGDRLHDYSLRSRLEELHGRLVGARTIG